MEKNLSELRTKLEKLQHLMIDTANQNEAIINRVHPDQKISACNLFHYLAMRCEDLRNIQDDLHIAGLSSLSSSESHALRQVQSVLERIKGKSLNGNTSPIDYHSAARAISARANQMFGSNKINPLIPHLMVTFDSSLADDYESVKALLQAGMNVARINCAHDSEPVWVRMIENIRKAERATGFICRVYIDLAGPKIRTIIPKSSEKSGKVPIREGECILLSERESGRNKKQKTIGCTLPGVVNDLKVGDRVLFDDGVIEAIVEAKTHSNASLRIKRISSEKQRIKAEKGINFPDTTLSVSCLTDFDRSVIPFALQYADVVGFSFVRRVEDVMELQKMLRNGHQKSIPIVLKIETYEAVQNLPALLLQGMKEPVFGVMIARGDLAVEIGFERLSEIQEEILWLCEAAHVPVIWATQVLESLNKSGIATRSEVTDAARAAHAECVMLNKGKHMLAVIATLRNILHRSGGHHLKKRYIFRPLNIAEEFLKNKIADGRTP